MTLNSPLPRLIIMQGVSGSGKSTWAKKYAADNGFIIVSRDEIRKSMLGREGVETYFQCGLDFSIEEEVTKQAHRKIARHLMAGQNVIIDDTNLRKKYITPIISIALRCGVAPEQIVFHRMDGVSLEDATARVASRGERLVSARVIDAQLRSLAGCWWTVDDIIESAPQYEHELFFPKFPVDEYVADKSKQEAIIVDIDGTLAHRSLLLSPTPHFRSFYSYQDCKTDEVDCLVRDIVVALAHSGKWIIFVTGRKNDSEQETVEFLKRAVPNISYSLFMRDPKIDFHNGKDDSDDIVKYRLFNENIRDHFNVIGVIDDRKRVLAMWEALGIKTINVGGLNDHF